MPVGRTAVAYTPTEEELAALESELAAQEAVPSPGLGGGTAEAAPVPPPPQSAPPPQEYVPAYPSSSDVSPSGRDFAAATGVNDTSFLPPPPPQQVGGRPGISYPQEARDPYAQDVPSPAVGPLSDERYANNQRVAQFQREQAAAAVPPPNAQAISPERRGDLRGDMFALVDQSRQPPPNTSVAQSVRLPGRRGGAPAIFDEAWRPQNLPATTSPSPEQQAVELAEGLVGGGADLLGRIGRGFVSGATPDPRTVSEAQASINQRGDIIPPDSGLTDAYDRLRAQLAAETSDAGREQNRQVVVEALGGAGSQVEQALQRQDVLRQEGAQLRGEPAAMPAPPPTNLRVSAPQTIGGRPAGSISGMTGGVRPATANMLPTPDVALPAVNFLEDVVAPNLPWNQRSGAPASTTTRPGNDPLADIFAEEAALNPATAGRGAAPVPPGGVPAPNQMEEEPGAEGTGITFIKANGVYVGARNDAGQEVMWGPNATKEQGDAALARLGAAAPVSSPTTTSTPASVPAPASTTTSSRGGGSSSGGGGGGWVDYGSSGGGGSRGSSRSESDFDDFFSSFDRGGDDEGAGFTAEDFLDEADGDRKRATALARAANRKRKRGGKSRTRTGGGRTSLPSRAPTPLRTAILTALQESMSRR